ncbi:MAG: hypothetical protein JXR96_28385 [Deltaproteobacteria bacterium]|nr:hypothetical protein [Deltaproteobacteria bacterium]
MKTWIAILAVLCSLGALAGAIMSCGGDGGCPGIVCHDCGASGDCDVTCTGSDVEYCGHFGYFEDPDLRCAFCAPEDFEF